MKNNYCIIMAGGVGSRFWPFSTNAKPKQFLDFFGTGKSLLQMTFERFTQIMPAENILIVSNANYKELILEQLPQIGHNQVLLEPLRRNTAPCIAYGVSKIYAMNPDANIIVAPSDHLILKEDEFLRVLKHGLDYTLKHPRLLTLGMKPTRPETGYGYIQIGEGHGAIHKVKTFTEKPNLEMARVFVESGEFYWNSGMFLFNVNTILEAFREQLPEVTDKFAAGMKFYNTENEQKFINEVYPTCPNISIDYGIMEKARNVSVLLADFGWSDLGTWGSLYELSDKDDNGNAAMKSEAVFYNSNNNMVVLPSGKLAVVDGLDGYLVAEEDDVLLICKKDEEHRIRQFVNDVTEKFDGKYV